MKKGIILFFIIICCILVSITYIFSNYNNNVQKARKENEYYEYFKTEEILGTDIATLINKIVDVNTQNEIAKNNQGYYIDDKEKSIILEIKFIDNDKTYRAEQIYSNGIEKFIKHYNLISFKCNSIKYHDSSKKVAYMLFEQTK